MYLSQMDTLINSPFWPFAVLILGIVVVALMISKFRIHPFVALMLSAIFVGLISAVVPGGADIPHVVRAVEQPMIEFGTMAGKIAWVIALAAVIGTAMMESGAAQRIVDWLINALRGRASALGFVDEWFFTLYPRIF